jgi:hypothetical protein
MVIMVQFEAIIKRFQKQGEKTGWTYIDVPSSIATQLKPDCKKTFRVSGLLDQHIIDRVALVPMGEGDFILALNADMRKATGKKQGMSLTAQLKLDEREIKPPSDFIACLKDEPAALTYYETLAKSHQLYFTRWIDSAKTDATRTKRIAKAITALVRGMGFPEMLREGKKQKEMYE